MFAGSSRARAALIVRKAGYVLVQTSRVRRTRVAWSGVVLGPQMELAASELALNLLAPYQDRLQHTVGVARQARIAAATVDPADIDVLLAAAWLHDIGYAEQIRRCGFHPLDGARHLERTGWPQRVCGLVAFHSGANFVAVELGLSNLLARFIDEQGLVQDALTFADQTTGPTGALVSFERRVHAMLERHGPDSPNARVHPRRGPFLAAAVERVQVRLGRAPAAGRDDDDSYLGRHRSR